MKRILICLLLASGALIAQEPAKKSALTPYRKRLLKYFGLSILATYGSLYALNKNASVAVSNKRLLAYSAGIPSVLGLGLYLATIYSDINDDDLIGIRDPQDLQKFLLTYAGIASVGTFGYMCASAKLSGQPVHAGAFALDALGYTGAGYGITAGSYFASLLLCETGLLQG